MLPHLLWLLAYPLTCTNGSGSVILLPLYYQVCAAARQWLLVKKSLNKKNTRALCMGKHGAVVLNCCARPWFNVLLYTRNNKPAANQSSIEKCSISFHNVSPTTTRLADWRRTLEPIWFSLLSRFRNNVSICAVDTVLISISQPPHHVAASGDVDVEWGESSEKMSADWTKKKWNKWNSNKVIVELPSPN